MPHPIKHAFAAALAVMTVTLAGTLRTDAAPNVSHFTLDSLNLATATGIALYRLSCVDRGVY